MKKYLNTVLFNTNIDVFLKDLQEKQNFITNTMSYILFENYKNTKYILNQIYIELNSIIKKFTIKNLTCNFITDSE